MQTTREGRRFLLATCLIGLAAVNTGNNLIYLILSLMVSFVLLSYGVLRLTLPGLSARMVVRHPVFVGEPVPARLILENAGGRLSAYSVHISVADRRISAESAYCPMVRPGDSREARQEMTFRRRGRFDTVACELSSSFPFVLFSRRRKVACAAGITVYPQLRDVAEREPSYGKSGESSLARVTGRGDELHSLREYRAGDDVRTIYWKASAKADALIVREFAEHDATRITLVVDNLRDRDEETQRRAEETARDTDEEFEKAVSMAASLARYFLDGAYLVRLISSRATIPFGAGQEHFLLILDFLAVIGLEDGWDQQQPGGDEGEVFVIARRRGGLIPGAAGGGMVIYASDL